MSVFKSAMGYFSSGGANGGSDNDFVGQFVEIGNMKLRVKKVIAEGMCNFLFLYHFWVYLGLILWLVALGRPRGRTSIRCQMAWVINVTILGADEALSSLPTKVGALDMLSSEIMTSEI